METVQSITRTYIDALHRAEQVTTRYGNQRKAQKAAFRHARDQLTVRGWPVASAKEVLFDAHDLFVLERDAT